VSEPAEPARIVADAERAVGPLWLLVASAGGPPPGRFLDLQERDWEIGYHRTLMSAVRLARAVLPGMIERRGGRIVFIASSTAKQPIDGLVLSNVYRPGVIGLTKSLADEAAAHGVTVNSVCPGPYKTDRVVELFEDRAKRDGIDVAEAKRRYLANVPVGRLGEPIELGRLVAFLGSEAGAFVTGVAWSADGGQVRGIHG
ncbi:MAG: SDR family oxidoreductase, partial [Candidatus Latescibacteria bacterium]|nr:SDR family oxidoreductase [Candidatus Latescibacterota bacterium]